MIYGYCRCSMEKKQTCSNQHFAIIEYAKSNRIKVDRWVEENISSRKPLNKREQPYHNRDIFLLYHSKSQLCCKYD